MLKLAHDFERFHAAESSNIEAIWHDALNSRMVFKFKKGNPYLVEGVPVYVADQFREECLKFDGSPGGLYHSLIRKHPDVYQPRELKDEEFELV